MIAAILVVVIVFVVIFAVLAVVVLMPKTTIIGTNVGDTPPDFTLTDTNNVQWNLNAHKENRKPILLEFMHPQCTYCQQEVEAASSPLRSLYNSYSTRIELVSVAITLEQPGFTNPPNVTAVNQFKAQYGTDWTYLVDTSVTPVRDMYQVSGIPMFYLIGPSGKITYIQQGGGALDGIIAEINKELNP